MRKAEITCLGRCDGLGDLDRSGSYVRLVYEASDGRHGIVISEGQAAVLAAELSGAVAQQDDARLEAIMRQARAVSK